MAIYEITSDRFQQIHETSFSRTGLREREDLQRLLRRQIDVVSPDTLIISEEFGHWEDSNRRIDLLGIDNEANLVVIELKRTEDGGHMDLQAIRYAAMVSAMTFEGAVEVYREFIQRMQSDADAEESLLEFLGWEEPDEDRFGQDVRIVLVSAEFSKELTTAVIWLNERGLDIRCIRMKPYQDNGRILADVQQIIPLPEAEDYRVRLKEKQEKERAAARSKREPITEAEFLQDLNAKQSTAAATVGRELIKWGKDAGLPPHFTKGKTTCSFIPVLKLHDRSLYPLSMQSQGMLYIQMLWLKKHPPFDQQAVRNQLRDRLLKIPEFEFGPKGMEGFPAISLQALAKQAWRDELFTTLTWMLDQLRNHDVADETTYHEQLPQDLNTLTHSGSSPPTQ